MFSAGYVAQLATPLRLDHDSIIYLAIAHSVAEGEGWRHFGASSPYPPGYPALLLLIHHLRIPAAAAIVALQLVGLGIGVYAATVLARSTLALSRAATLWIALGILASFAYIKHVTLPRPDVLFFAATMLALGAMMRASRSARGRRIAWLGAALMAVVVAISLRTAGVALLPALAVVLLVPGGRPVAWWRGAPARARRRVLLTGGLVIIAGVGAVAGSSSYIAELIGNYSTYGVLDVVRWNARAKLLEAGQLLLNAPLGQLPSLEGLTNLVVAAAGAVLLVLLLRALWLRRSEAGFVEVHVLSYLGMLAVWPGEDVRFWLPLFPLVLALLIAAGPPRADLRISRFAVGALAILYASAGLAAMIHSTRLSWSGAMIAERYGRGVLRASYRAALQGQAPDRAAEMDPAAYALLRRYEPRSLRMPCIEPGAEAWLARGYQPHPVCASVGRSPDP